MEATTITTTKIKIVRVNSEGTETIMKITMVATMVKIIKVVDMVETNTDRIKIRIIMGTATIWIALIITNRAIMIKAIISTLSILT